MPAPNGTGDQVRSTPRRWLKLPPFIKSFLRWMTRRPIPVHDEDVLYDLPLTPARATSRIVGVTFMVYSFLDFMRIMIMIAGVVSVFTTVKHDTGDDYEGDSAICFGAVTNYVLHIARLVKEQLDPSYHEIVIMGATFFFSGILTLLNGAQLVGAHGLVLATNQRVYLRRAMLDVESHQRIQAILLLVELYFALLFTSLNWESLKQMCCVWQASLLWSGLVIRLLFYIPVELYVREVLHTALTDYLIRAQPAPRWRPNSGPVGGTETEVNQRTEIRREESGRENIAMTDICERAREEVV